MSIVLRSFIFVAGLFLILVTLRSLIHRGFSEWQALFWIFCGLVVMIISIFPTIPIFIARLFGVDYVPSIFFAIALIMALYGIFYCYRAISSLQNRVHELAMQVSMLNHENSLMQVKNGQIHGAQGCQGTGTPDDEKPYTGSQTLEKGI